MAEYTYILKVVMAGRTRCGKSSLMARYCDGTFREDVSSTIGSGTIYLGVDFKIKLVTAHGQNHKLQIWDTSGVERFQSITASYYRGASTIILVFALNDRESFQLLDGYYRLAQMHNPDAKFAVIGNKSDAANRVVPPSHYRRFRSMKLETLQRHEVCSISRQAPRTVQG
jgi:small GTP-binding protein